MHNPKQKKSRKIVLTAIPIAILSIALAVSLFYNSNSALPANHSIGIIYAKHDIDMDNGELRYSVHICNFVDDIQNDQKAGECRSYRVDKTDYESVNVNDIVKVKFIPGPFAGYNIMDIYEIYPADRYISNHQ